MVRAREKVTNLMCHSTALSMVSINEPHNQSKLFSKLWSTSLFISLSKYDYLHLVTVTLNDEVKNLKHIDKLYKNIQIVSEVFIKIFY